MHARNIVTDSAKAVKRAWRTHTRQDRVKNPVLTSPAGFSVIGRPVRPNAKTAASLCASGGCHFSLYIFEAIPTSQSYSRSATALAMSSVLESPPMS